jgi:hypothetical protein
VAKVIKTKSFDVSVDEMWKRVGEFHELHTWHPLIESSTPQEDGTVRALTIAGGGAPVLETLVDHGDHFYAYRIDDSPLPVVNCQSMLRVKATGPTSCEVEWEAEFAPSGSEDEAVQMIAGFYEAGLNAL